MLQKKKRGRGEAGQRTQWKSRKQEGSEISPCQDMECAACPQTEFEIIQRYMGNDDEALRSFEEHGVIPTKRQCRKCGRELSLRSDKRAFQCYRRIKDPRTKRVKRCDFYASQFKDTWLDSTKLSPGKNIVFINCFLRKTFSQVMCEKNLGLAAHTIVDWKNFCSSVCESWLKDQEPIGGPGTVVEIGEGTFGKCKLSPECIMEGVWVFGGIERETYRKFILPVERRDAATLIPLCQKYILPGTTIYSDKCEEYDGLSDVGYVHQVVNHSLNVNPDSNVSTNNIQRLLKELKCWVAKAGSKKQNYRQYFARYFYLYSHPDHKMIFHNFLKQIARVYPPPQ